MRLDQHFTKNPQNLKQFILFFFSTYTLDLLLTTERCTHKDGLYVQHTWRSALILLRLPNTHTHLACDTDTFFSTTITYIECSCFTINNIRYLSGTYYNGIYIGVLTPAVWPDLAILCFLGMRSKPVATIILPKLPTILGNFSKGVKIIHFWSEISSGQLFIAIW